MNWKTEIKEILNNVGTLILTHKLGPIINKTGTDIDLKEEAIADRTVYVSQIANFLCLANVMQHLLATQKTNYI